MFQVTYDDSQQIVEIVGNTTGQLSNCLHLLSLTKPIFDRLFFSDVARDLREAQQPSRLLITNSVDDDIRYEGAAIFADAPTFGLVFS